MKIYDITQSLSEGMPAYPGDPPFKRRIASSMKSGDSSEVSVIETGSHAGTHVDAPSHMIAGGDGIDRLAPEALVGPAHVFDCRRIEGHIDARHLKALKWRGVKRALFRTKNSPGASRRFDPAFTAFTEDAALFLAKKGVKLVGIDGPSVDRLHSGTHPAHIAFLKAGIVIVEGLNLDGIARGKYQLFCGPLKIKGGDGAPARVFLIHI